MLGLEQNFIGVPLSLTEMFVGHFGNFEFAIEERKALTSNPINTSFRKLHFEFGLASSPCLLSEIFTHTARHSRIF